MFWKKKEEPKEQPKEEVNDQPVEQTDQTEDQMNEEDIIQQKMAQGWIKVSTFIETMATSKELTESALKEHAEKIRFEQGIKIINQTWGEMQAVENPPRGAKEAFSQFVEMELLIKDFPMLMYFIMTYLPSGIEILSPENFNVQKGDAQNVANAIAALMHQYASTGAGGVVLLRPGSKDPVTGVDL